MAVQTTDLSSIIAEVWDRTIKYECRSIFGIASIGGDLPKGHEFDPAPPATLPMPRWFVLAHACEIALAFELLASFVYLVLTL